MEATVERTAEVKVEFGTEEEQLQEAIVKSYKENNWWCVEFRFEAESVYVYRPTLRDLLNVVGNKDSRNKGRYFVKEEKTLEELDVFFVMETVWGGSGSYGEDEEKLAAVAKAGAYAGEEITTEEWRNSFGFAESLGEERQECVERRKRLWSWKQKLGEMVEWEVRQRARWLR